MRDSSSFQNVVVAAATAAECGCCAVVGGWSLLTDENVNANVDDNAPRVVNNERNIDFIVPVHEINCFCSLGDLLGKCGKGNDLMASAIERQSNQDAQGTCQ